MKKLTFSLAAALGVVGTSFAGQPMVSHKEYKGPVPQEQCFKDRELQIDTFGAYADGNGSDHAGPIKDHGWGGGIGINYFFTRAIGIGVDATWLYSREHPALQTDESENTTIHNFSGSLIFRMPIDSMCLAPYAYLGGGFHVDGEQWASAHAGLGVEFRVVPQRVGLFADGRWTYFGDRFGAGDQNNFQGRVGIRLVF